MTTCTIRRAVAIRPSKKCKANCPTRPIQRRGGADLITEAHYHRANGCIRNFGDGVELYAARQPRPREQWKPPPPRPAEETEAALSSFGEDVDLTFAPSQEFDL